MPKFAKMLVVALVIGTCAGISGAPWAVSGNKYRIETIVLTGNYKSPRLMAELILYESRQPYLLIPAANSGEKYNFLVLPGQPAIPVTDSKFNQLIRNTGARRIVILGDTRYVPEKYEALLDKKIPIVRITGDDWNRIAEELTSLLNLSTLKSRYPEMQAKLVNDNNFYKPENPRLPVPKKTEKKGAAIPAATTDAPKK